MTERKRTKRKGSSGAVAVLVTFIVLIFFSTALLFLPEKEQEHKKRPTAAPVPTTGAVKETETEEKLAVVLSVDTETKLVRVYNVLTETEENYVYTGASSFFDGFDIRLSASQLKTGALFRFEMDKKEEWISTAKEAVDHTEKKKEQDDVWEKTGIDYMTLEEGKLTFRNQNYRYSENVCVISNGKRITVADLKPGVDIVTVRGVGQVVYEILVTKGHGYITLANHEDFIGGTITIGSTRVDSIYEEAKYLVREGTYMVSVSRDEYSGAESVTVAQDETAVFDVYEYGRGPIDSGWLNISVEPLGATLYIDGKKTAYTDGIELDYGVYNFEFTEGGYVSYKATVEINQPIQSLTVFLVEQEQEDTSVEIDDPTEPGTTTKVDPAETGSSGGNTDNEENGSGSSGTDTDNNANGGVTEVSIAHMTGYTLDADHSIFILGPTGADIYLDSEFIGTAPFSFEKIIGSYVITVLRPDGEVKNFNCTETDNGENSYYNFSWID